MSATHEPLELVFDLDTLELGDLEILEDVTGVPPMDLIDGLQKAAEENKNPDLKVLMAIVLINLRRTNPQATLDDARHFRFADLKFKQAPVPVDPPAAPEMAPTPVPEPEILSVVAVDAVPES